ncbi:MAG: peptide chain release factor family protein [Thermodesulfobacteriota bacterium]
MPPISKEKEIALTARMEKLGIQEEDLIEKFIRSSGKGGQKVNKTSSCVYLKHTPTGIEVKVQRERSQTINRFLARRLLCDKIEEEQSGRESQRQQAIEKIRRQKRRRSKRAREKILKDKKLLSIKKKLRSSIED